MAFVVEKILNDILLSIKIILKLDYGLLWILNFGIDIFYSEFLNRNGLEKYI